MPDLATKCAALRRELRRVLERCVDLQAELVIEKKRADDAEAWARSLIGRDAA